MPDDFLARFNNAGTMLDAAQEFGVRPELLGSLMHQESGGRSGAVSSAGAIGPMQLMPQTAAQPGYGMQPIGDIHDPVQNIRFGAQYLKKMLDLSGGDEGKALASYNAGPGRAAQAGPLPAETQKYVPAVQAGAAPADDDFLARFNAAGQPQANGAAPTQADSAPEGKSLAGFGSNVVTSGANFLGGMYNAVRHPIDTVTGLGKIAAGAAEMIPGSSSIPGVGDAITHMVGDHKADAQAFFDSYKKKYGSLDALKETLYNDPVGALADASMVLDPIAGGLKVAGLDTAARVVHAVSPGNIVGGVAEKIANTVHAVPEALMDSALKIPRAVEGQYKGVKMGRVALDTGATGVSPGQIGKLTEAIEAGPEAGKDAIVTKFGSRKMDVANPVLNALADKRADYMKGMAPSADVGPVDRIVSEIKTNPLLSQPGPSQTVQVPHTITVQVPTGVQGNSGAPITQSRQVTRMVGQRVPGPLVPMDVTTQTARDMLKQESQWTRGTFAQTLTTPPSEIDARHIMRNTVSDALKNTYDPLVTAAKNARGYFRTAADAVTGNTPKTWTELNQQEHGMLGLREGMRARVAANASANPLSLTMQLMGLGGVAKEAGIGGAAGALAGMVLSKPVPLSYAARAGNMITSPLQKAIHGLRPFFPVAGAAGRAVDMRNASPKQVDALRTVLQNAQQN